MKNIRFLSLSIGLALGLAAASAPALAHELVTDGQMGAVVHIDPDDAVVSGQVASFIYEFKYQKGDFQLTQCTCTLVISENGKNITTITPTPAADTPSVGLATYTFEHEGSYDVDMRGTPTIGASFPAFDLHSKVDVSEPAGSSAARLRLLLYGVIGVAALIVIIGGVTFARKR